MTNAPAPGEGRTSDWGPVPLFLFRFGALYLVLYNFLGPLAMLPGLSALTAPWDGLWNALVPWVGKQVLGLAAPIAVAENGSGDRTFNYVQILCFAAIAAGGALVWSVVDGPRGHHRKGLAYLRIYVRYCLAVSLLGYGMVKVFKSQFPALSPFRLTESYGESSPMGLLWTFMGHSMPYTMFAGLGEVAGGVLLLFRRTTTLGALVSAGVLLNVVMLNFCYDVPVKQFSLHLLAMAILLAAPDFRRLANVLVLDRPAPAAAPDPPLATGRRGRRAIQVIWGLSVAGAVGGTAVTGWHQMRTYGDAAPRHPLHGVYDVLELERNGQTVTTSSPLNARWRSVGIETRAMEVRLGDETRVMVPIKETDERARRLTLLRREAGGMNTYQLDYQVEGEGRWLTLRGKLGPDAVVARLQKRPESSFLLLSRGFRWINEFPYNR